MCDSWQCKWFNLLFIFIVVTNTNAKCITKKNGEVSQEKPGHLPVEFLHYVKDLDKMVFRRAHTETTTEINRQHVKTVDYKHRTRLFKKPPEKLEKEDLFGDMLMMKLISYYEKKFNIGESRTEARALTASHEKKLDGLKLFDPKKKQQKPLNTYYELHDNLLRAGIQEVKLPYTKKKKLTWKKKL